MDYVNHIVLCGFGHVGQRILGLLLQLGKQVVVISQEAPREWAALKNERCTLLLGDARDEQLLHQAQLKTASAIIVATNDDLSNVSIALDAKRINPKTVVVVRLFDQDLAVHLEKAVGIHRALSASAIAAPGFIAAALGGSARGMFEIGNGICIIEDHQIEGDIAAQRMPLKNWIKSGNKAVVGFRRDGQHQMRFADDVLLSTGDKITCVRMEHKQALAPRHSDPQLNGIARHLFHGMCDWWHDVPYALRVALMVLLGVVILSVVVFESALNLSFDQALYFVVTTITTVGFGDYNLMNAAPFLKYYGIFLMLCGAAIMAVLFSIVTDMVLSIRFRDVLARGCSHFHGHIIVTGLGNIGYRVVRELTRCGETVVAVESKPDAKFIDAARAVAPVILGNARAEETLQKAGLKGAKAVLAATADEITNLGIGLAAKRASNDCRVVVRVFDAKLAEKMQQTLSVDAVLSVSGESAPTFVAAALGPDVLHGFILDDRLVAIYKRTHTSQNDKDSVPPLANPEGGPLFIRKPGQHQFTVCEPGDEPLVGDEIVGARWYRLTREV